MAGQDEHIGQLALAIQQLESAPQSAVPSEHREQLAFLYLELGKALWMKHHPSFDPEPTFKHFDKPRMCLDTALNLVPGDHWIRLEALHKLAEIEVYKGKFDSSMRLVAQALDVQDRLAEADPVGKLGIRFLQTRSGTLTNIGQLVNEVEYLVKTTELGWQKRYTWVLLAPNGQTANAALLAYLRRYVVVITDPDLCQRLAPHARNAEWNTFFFRLPSGKVEWQWSGMVAAQAEWERQGRAPILTLTPDDIARARHELERVGIPRDAWFVCLHVREAKHEVHNSGTGIRNGRIETYIPAIEAITSRGGWVIRMGDTGMTPLPAMKGVLDYAHSSVKSDWLDIVLSASCRFFLGTASGLCGIPMVFGAPVILTNVCPTNSYPLSEKDLYLPKLFRDNTTNQFVPFRDALRAPFRNCYNDRVLKERNISVVDNTPDELREITEEMLERLTRGASFYSEMDERRQHRFRALVQEHESLGWRARIGRAFLERHEGLLGELWKGSALERTAHLGL